MKPFLNLRSGALTTLVVGAFVVPSVCALAQPPSPPSVPDAPKPPKTRSNVTIIKDGEVVFSKSLDKGATWRSLDDTIDNELADSIKKRVRAALKDAGGRVNINATGNTMTIVVDDDNDKDGKNIVMSFTGDGGFPFGHFAEHFRHNFHPRHFNFDFRGPGDFRGLRDMAKRMRVMVAPHARSWRFDDDDDRDFSSREAERMADEAKDLSREAEALRKEAEAMRLESEAMKKRAEAMRLEAEARKKSDKGNKGDKSDATETVKKKK